MTTHYELTCTTCKAIAWVKAAAHDPASRTFVPASDTSFEWRRGDAFCPHENHYEVTDCIQDDGREREEAYA